MQGIAVVVLGLGDGDGAASFAVVVGGHELCERDIGWAADGTGAGRLQDSEVPASCSAVAGREVFVAMDVVGGSGN